MSKHPGGLWEYPEWELKLNYECSSYGGGKACKHCTVTPTEPQYRSDGSQYNTEEKTWICPRVVIALNEGGYNSTGVCADCILEALDEVRPPQALEELEENDGN